MDMWFDKLTDCFFRPCIRTPKEGAATAIHLLLDEEVLHPYNESKNKAVTNNKNIFFKFISPKFIYQLQALTKTL